MAMTLAMDREPEVARFIDTYKFDQDMATKRDRFGGGTSLPLNSDGYEDKQRALRDERHKDWLVQQDKQRHAEQQKQEARRYAPQARPAQPLGPQMDYNAAGELAKAEEKKAYQDYMKAKEERYWALRGRPVTPPGGLNIGQYDRQVKEQAPQKKQEYKRMLDEQQKEHMFLRARQEPEMAVIDRNAQSSQFLANKPPPGPSYGRGRDEDEKRKHESEVFQQQHGGKPAEIVKNPFYSSDDYEKFQKELKKKQEKEYSEFLSKQKVAHPGRRHEFVDSANGPYGGLFHGLGEHGNRSDDLNRERHREYNEKLEQQYAGRDRPGGRPKWVQESLPNNTDRGRSPMKTQPPTDQYQQMLNEKRREEANMRRYEDPEYQDRLAHGRDRGEAGQRYGY